MQVRRRFQSPHALAILLLAGSATFVCGQDHETTQKSLLAGLPSSVSLHHAEVAANHSVRDYNKKNGGRRKKYEEEAAQVDQQHHTQVATSNYGQKIYRRPPTTIKHPPKGKRKQPIIEKIPGTVIVKTNYQDTTLSFVDPRQQVVAGLRVIATIHRKTPRPGQEEDVVIGNSPNAPLITDAQGRLSLKKIGPLPVAIQIAFPEDQGKEWQVANAQTASLFIPTGGIGPSREFNGRRVAIYSEEVVHAPAMRLARADSRLENCALQESGNHSRVRLAGLPGQAAERHGDATRKTTLQPAKTAVRTEYKDVVFSSADPTTVSVEHNFVDVQVTTQPGSVLTTPAVPNQTWTADAAGAAVCKVPVAALGNGAIPIRVKKDLPGGEAEAVIPTYKTDPYDRDNPVKCDKLHLVRLTDLKVNRTVDVLDRANQIKAKAGDPGNTQSEGNGSQSWDYPQHGLQLMMRPAINPDAPMMCESFTLTQPHGGVVGGITVGSARDEVRKALGEPQDVSGQTEIYMDNGLIVQYAGDKVQAIEVRRSSELLKAGTTAFVPRPKARLFVENFTGHDHTGLTTKNELRDYLRQVHSIELVDARENADLVLSASTGFHESKDKLAGTLPFRYQCDVNVDYTLTDVEKAKNVGRTGARAEALADYEEEVEEDKPLMQALLNHEDAREILESIDRTAPDNEMKLLSKSERVQRRVQHLLDLQYSMRNAARRCPIIASRTAFGQMVTDIGQAADFSVRVTDIDYTSGTISLNVGKADGVQVSTEQNPYQFEILVAGESLPYHEQGLSADYYTAVVTDVQDHVSTCQLRHRWRLVNQGADTEHEQTALEAVQRIPDPATGIVSARAWLPNPKLDASLIVPEDPEYAEFTRYVFASDQHHDYSGYQKVFDRIIVFPDNRRIYNTRNVIFLPPQQGQLKPDSIILHRGRRENSVPPPIIDWQHQMMRDTPGIRIQLPRPAEIKIQRQHWEETNPPPVPNSGGKGGGAGSGGKGGGAGSGGKADKPKEDKPKEDKPKEDKPKEDKPKDGKSGKKS